MLALSLFGGLVMLAVGGDILVRGAVAVARRIGVSPLVIGLTLVGFGTSMPELVTSINAALAGSDGVAIGNVVGSNIANILLILGVAAIIAPIACNPVAFRRDGWVLALSAALAAAVMMVGSVGRVAGIALVASIAVYTGYTYLSERRSQMAAKQVHEQEAAIVAAPAWPLWIWLGITGIGIALTILGARLLVDAAIELARQAGVSESVIGLTLVAVGTSLPELATSVTAAIRRQGDVAFGNVVGSNIFNVLGILGVAALVEPLAVPRDIIAFDLWVMLAVTGLAIVMAITGWRITRREGGVLLAGYGGYLAVLAAGAA
ncbi:MAG: calcium/sodium antiporter [Rhodospirillaceae bacterium]|nr:calcium/sodium antiporter [Rhodospirillaceae bacterium]